MIENDDVQESRVFWRRFAVILLAVFFCACAIYVSVWVYFHLLNGRINAAVSALEKVGAHVQRGVSSERYFVDINDPHFTDAQLAAIEDHLHTLEPLGNVNLRDTRITDKSVDLLGRCDIGALVISNTGITDAGALEIR